jgi:hypothetical protein
MFRESGLVAETRGWWWVRRANEQICLVLVPRSKSWQGMGVSTATAGVPSVSPCTARVYVCQS